MRLSRKIGIIEDAEQRVLDAGFVKSAQQKDSVAAPTAARIVGDIGKDKGRQRGVRPTASAFSTASSSEVSRG